MPFTLSLQHRADQSAWDITDTVEKIEVESKLRGCPGKMTLTFYQSQSRALPIACGDVVCLFWNNQPLFWGFVFTLGVNRWGKVEVTTYDQQRYLKAQDTFQFANQTLAQIIKTIALKYKLKVGTLADSSYPINLITDNQGLFDTIERAMAFTYQGMDAQFKQNKISKVPFYVFYDQAGALMLTEVSDLLVGSVIGQGSLVTDYTFTQTIDKETYNWIRLEKPNKEAGKSDIVEVRDAKNIAQWGILQKHQKVNENYNLAQMTELAQSLLDVYNIVLQTLKIEALGIPGLFAGNMIALDIPGIGSQHPMLIDSVDHHIQQSTHTMSLNMRVLA